MTGKRPTVLQVFAVILCQLCSLVILTVVCSLAFIGSCMFIGGVTTGEIPLVIIGPAVCALALYLLDLV